MFKSNSEIVDLDKADLEESGHRITHRISEILFIICISILEFTFLFELPRITSLLLSRQNLVRDYTQPRQVRLLMSFFVHSFFIWFLIKSLGDNGMEWTPGQWWLPPPLTAGKFFLSLCLSAKLSEKIPFSLSSAFLLLKQFLSSSPHACSLCGKVQCCLFFFLDNIVPQV